jgi:hypothetical protein
METQCVSYEVETEFMLKIFEIQYKDTRLWFADERKSDVTNEIMSVVMRLPPICKTVEDPEPLPLSHILFLLLKPFNADR